MGAPHLQIGSSLANATHERGALTVAAKNDAFLLAVQTTSLTRGAILILPNCFTGAFLTSLPLDQLP